METQWTHRSEVSITGRGQLIPRAVARKESCRTEEERTRFRPEESLDDRGIMASAQRERSI